MPDPFISTQDLVDILGHRATAGTADPGLIIAADFACDLVRTATERTFNLETSTVTLDGTGTDRILLPELPVTAAGTVTVNGGTITDYVLNDNGILFRGTAGVDPRPEWPAGRQNIRVTYTHGYADVDIPRDVRGIALQLAERFYVQNVAQEETVGDVSIKYSGEAAALTPNERLHLSNYRHIRSR